MGHTSVADRSVAVKRSCPGQWASRRMRRTTSGSDLAHQRIFDSATPYVHMQATHGVPSAVETCEEMFRRRCIGGKICHRCSTVQQNMPQVHLPPCVDVEIAGAHMTAKTACMGNRTLFFLPLSAIRHASVAPAEGFYTCITTVSRCFCGRIFTLLIDVEAPFGWLQMGSRSLTGSLRLILLVRDAQEWLEQLKDWLDHYKSPDAEIKLE